MGADTAAARGDAAGTVVVGYVAGRFEHGVVAPIAALVLAAMLTVVGLVWWTAAQHDRIALRDEARLLRTGLDARLSAEAEMLYDYAFWDEAYEKAHLAPDPAWAVDNIGGWAHERLGVAATFILDPGGRTWFAFVDGALAEGGDARAHLGEAAWAHVEAVRRAAPDRPRAAYAPLADGRVAVVTASTVGTHTDKVARRPGPPSAMVQVTFLGGDDLAKIAQVYLLPELRLVATAAGRAAAGGAVLDVPGPGGGRPVAALAWRSSAPGRDLLGRVLPVLGIATLSLALLTWVVLRHARDAAAALARSERRASRDPLTGLANRRLLEDRLERAFARLPRGPGGAALALLYLDLDGFKPVNDRLGHAAGDEVLREVGRRLRALAREGDTVARVGGDEFVVLQEGGGQPAGALRLAEAAVAELARPIPLEGGGAAEVGVSVGVALAPSDAATPRDLARRADVALYKAKSGGRGTWRLFADDVSDRPAAGEVSPGAPEAAPAPA